MDLRKKFKKTLLTLISVFLSTIFMIILFWPMLWENPIQEYDKRNFKFSKSSIKSKCIFFGKTISVTDVPWYYLFTWIFITTPILNISLFFLEF